MKNSKEEFESFKFLPEIIHDLKTPLNTIFSFAELLKFEVERKKKMRVDTSFAAQDAKNSEFDNYAEYAKEISDAVFIVNKILEELMQKNLRLKFQLNEKK